MKNPSNQEIKPLETLYNGIRFRSRLEARWAAYFDLLKISYEYEPEGFELADGTWYLPDFKLVDDGIYVEIKAIGALKIYDDNDLIYNGREEADKYNLAVKFFKPGTYILCIGSPLETEYKKEGGRFWWYDTKEDNKERILSWADNEYGIPWNGKAAEAVNGLRFNKTDSQYLKEFVNEKWEKHFNFEKSPKMSRRSFILLNTKLGRYFSIESNVLGLIYLHPEYVKIKVDGKDVSDHEFAEESFNQIIWLIYITVEYYDENKCAGNPIDSVKRAKGFRGKFTTLDVMLFEQFGNSRKDLSNNDEDTYKEYLRELLNYNTKEKNGKLDEVLKKKREENNEIE